MHTRPFATKAKFSSKKSVKKWKLRFTHALSEMSYQKSDE